MKAQTSYLGIDVSKSKLHLATPEKFLGEFANTNAGLPTLVKRIQELQPQLVALEATGGYERALCEALQNAGVPVALSQAGCVRNFAKSLKVLAKTDAIDAQVIARYAEAVKPRPTPPTAANTRKIRALRDRRRQIVEDRVREQGRLESCADAVMAKHIQKQLKHLAKLEAALDQQIKTLVEEDAQFQQVMKVLTESKGVGNQTVITLLAYLPELGNLSRGKIAAIAGLAPHPQDSGNWSGKRRIYGGRPEVRTAMYMAALSASHRCPVISQFYQRLRAEGKAGKVALIACARKMLIHLNTKMKKLIEQIEEKSAPTTAQST